MIKAAFFDVDGTLLNNKTKVLPESAVSALKKLKKNGIKIFICTGRSMSMTGFLKDIMDFDGFVTVNGQYCVCGNTIVRAEAFDKRIVKDFINLSQRENISSLFVEDYGITALKIDEYVRLHCKFADHPLPNVVTSDELIEHKIYQMVAHVPENQDTILSEKLQNVDVVRSFDLGLDIMPKGGDKKKGMEAVMKHFGLNREEIIAFGDGSNDLSMLKFAGIGVAMGNARERVKEVSDFVTDRVDNDGVAKALAHFKLI